MCGYIIIWHAQDLEEREQMARVENDRFRQRYDLDENVGNPDAARLKIQVHFSFLNAVVLEENHLIFYLFCD